MDRPSGAPAIHIIRNTQFRRLWTAQVLSQSATSTLLFVLALRLYQITGSNTAVSGIFIVYGIPALMIGMVAGTIVDKVENRTVLMFCDLSRAIISLGFILFPTHVAAIYLFTFVNSVITQFYVPAEGPAIPLLVPKREVVTANSLFSFTYYTSIALGSIFAGPMLRVFGPIGVFLLLTFMFLAAAANVSRLPRLHRDRSARALLGRSLWYLTVRIAANIREGIGYIRSNRTLVDALLLLVSTQVTLAILGTLGPGFADRVLAIDIRDASLLITGPAVLGIILGALWVGSFGYRFAKEKLIQTGIITAGVALIAVAGIVRLTNVPVLEMIVTGPRVLFLATILFFVLGWANSLLDVPANSILQEKAVGNMRGRVYGVLAAAVGGLGVLPVILGGVLADAVGVGKVIFFLGICIFLYGAVRVQYKRQAGK
ncbi:hypothetical protein A2Z33_01300 [Candidatus Gottesmanbacteria bacterium RBG_16_52_11]|uniref:Major facilitator superfamily (MFS) profile domain-containing protein n=1 Tax=Candidatus Gottesmanbacteria bacterium RBG_16_52_11 TaxID=1798374 RepID=A0A1F5YNU6_9BACT|nr:MAG: hypothetical protein A2Z33_01300 [Candidatus Gottesmanbacteria bacterium RBG_16_52_11]